MSRAAQAQLLAPMSARASLPAVQRKATTDLNSDFAGPAVPRFVQSLSALPALPKPQRLHAATASKKPRRKPADASLLEGEDKETSGQGTPVRPSLEVGPANDSFEREADAIAAETLADPVLPAMGIAGATFASRETLSPALQPLCIRRRCAACGGEEENARARRKPVASRIQSSVQRKCAACAEEEEKLARKRDKGGEMTASDPPRLAASPSALTSGGRALPSSTRDFFEGRMGRDLSHVRVHEGSEAGRLNAGIDAHAFTYGSHIWLGEGEKADTGFTMAHELAHVLQQTQPGETRARRKGLEASSAMARVQRLSAYMRAFWLPSGMTAGARKLHTTMHNLAADKLVQESAGSTTDRLIREAPIPGGNRDQGSTLDPGNATTKIRGFADIYRGATTVGLQKNAAALKTPGSNAAPPVHNFLGPRNHKAKQGKDLSPFVHETSRAPKMAAVTKKIDLTNAPTEIAIADVKPGHNLSEREGGTKQIQNYLNGIADVVTTTNGYLSQTQPGDSWSCNPVHMPQSGLTVVKGWDPDGTGKAATKKLKLWHEGKPLSVKGGTAKGDDILDVSGRWVMAPDRKNKGIWGYFMLPDQTGLDKALADKGIDPKFAAVAKALREKVFDGLTNPSAAPTGAKPLRRKAAASAPKVMRVTPKKPKKSAAPTPKDNFDFKEWEQKRVGNRPKPNQSYKQIFEENIGQSEKDTAVFQMTAADSVKEIEDHFAINAGLTIKRQKEVKDASKLLKKLEFWKSPKAKVFGLLRSGLGRVFIAVWEAGIKAKEYLKPLLEKFSFNKTGSAKGLKGVAMRVLGKLVRIVGASIVERTIDHLVECVSNGVSGYFKQLVETEIDELEAKVEPLEKFVKDIEKSIMEKVHSLFDETSKKFESEINAFKELSEEAQEILDLVSAIRDVIDTIRIVGCLMSSESGPGAIVVCSLALLDKIASAFDASPLDMLADALMNSCDAQQMLVGAINAMAFVKNIPINLGSPIRQKIEDLLPEGFKQLICSKAEFEKGIVPFKPEDLPCKHGGGGTGTGTGTGTGQGAPGRARHNPDRPLRKARARQGTGTRMPAAAAPPRTPQRSRHKAKEAARPFRTGL